MCEHQDRIDANVLSERVDSLRSEIDGLYAIIFSDATVSSVSIEALTVGLDKTWRDLLPSFASMKPLEYMTLEHVFLRKPMERIEDPDTVFLVQTHFENSLNDAMASVNLGYLKNRSSVVVSADLKPGINVERADEEQNDLREALRLQMLKEIMTVIASHLFDD